MPSVPKVENEIVKKMDEQRALLQQLSLSRQIIEDKLEQQRKSVIDGTNKALVTTVESIEKVSDASQQKAYAEATETKQMLGGLCRETRVAIEANAEKNEKKKIERHSYIKGLAKEIGRLLSSHA